MAAFKMSVPDSAETTNVITVLQMVFGCIYQMCDNILTIYVFATGDEDVIREELEEIGAVYCGTIAIC